MKPSQKNKQLRTQRAKSGALFLIGSGLVLISVVIFLTVLKPALANQASNNASSGGSEYSVVPMQVNFQAPKLTLTSLTGEDMSLSKFQGQVVLVNNWATWCPPCKAEMPSLQSFYEDHAEDGFTLIGIESGESADEVSQFVDSFGLTFHIWLDPDGKALLVFHNNNLPSSYVIDREGTVRLAWTGPISLKMLEEYVTPLIEE